MIQFVGFSHAAADATTVVGGTQDNGSPAVSSASPSSGNWLSVNNGDGGFNAINPLNANEWFTSNPAPLVAGRRNSALHEMALPCTFNGATCRGLRRSRPATRSAATIHRSTRSSRSIRRRQAACWSAPAASGAAIATEVKAMLSAGIGRFPPPTARRSA